MGLLTLLLEGDVKRNWFYVLQRGRDVRLDKSRFLMNTTLINSMEKRGLVFFFTENIKPI